MVNFSSCFILRQSSNYPFCLFSIFPINHRVILNLSLKYSFFQNLSNQRSSQSQKTAIYSGYPHRIKQLSFVRRQARCSLHRDTLVPLSPSRQYKQPIISTWNSLDKLSQIGYNQSNHYGGSWDFFFRSWCLQGLQRPFTQMSAAVDRLQGLIGGLFLLRIIQ